MISVESVTKRFGDLTAVDDLSFQVDRGEVLGFLGPNGAGKTTTMRMLTGTLEPDQGSVLFEGVPVAEDLKGAKARVGYLPESNPIYEEMLVAEYLGFVSELRGMVAGDARRALTAAIEETGIGDVFFRPIGELSKGYRQRVGLAGAILHQPEILILDEPTEGLDPNQRVEIRRLVAELGKERTVLLCTHVMQEVEATCSRLVILNRGKLVAKGSVQDLLATGSGRARYIVEAEGEGIAESLTALRDVRALDTDLVDGRTRVRLEAPGDGEIRPEVFGLARERGWTLWELHREQASLEDVFRQLTSEGEEAGS